MAIDYIEGIMESIWEGKTARGRDMYTIHINGKKIGCFGSVKSEIRQAMDKKVRVRIGFTMSQDGQYMNFEPGEFSVITAGEQQKILHTSSSTFTSADHVEGVESLIGEAAYLMRACRTAFFHVYGTDPVTDGDKAIVNTAFIFLSRHWASERWLRSILDLTIEEHLRAGREKKEKTEA